MSSDGTFVIPASTPADLILDFLHKNKDASFAAQNEHNRYVKHLFTLVIGIFENDASKVPKSHRARQ